MNDFYQMKNVFITILFIKRNMRNTQVQNVYRLMCKLKF